MTFQNVLIINDQTKSQFVTSEAWKHWHHSAAATQ